MMFKPLDLIGLGQVEEAALSQHGTADLVELLLKQSRKRTFFGWIKAHPEEVRKLLERFYGKSGIVYILGVEAKHTAQEVIQAIIEITPEKFMSDITIHNPHDFLVKKAFGHKEVMQDFLQSRLPQEDLKRIDMKSLRLTNKSFSTKKGKQKHSDLIYAASIDGQDGYLYISLEHQSKEEKYMPLRQLEYNVLLMRQHLEEGHTSLPLILNICLYNGDQPYQGAVTLLELFAHPEIAKKYLLEGYHLVDLRSDSMEKIQQDKQAALAELILKQGKYTISVIG